MLSFLEYRIEIISKQLQSEKFVSRSRRVKEFSSRVIFINRRYLGILNTSNLIQFKCNLISYVTFKQMKEINLPSGFYLIVYHTGQTVEFTRVEANRR